jgi:hypothetical protein
MSHEKSQEKAAPSNNVSVGAIVMFLRAEIYSYYNQVKSGIPTNPYIFLSGLIERCPLDKARQATSAKSFLKTINNYIQSEKLILSFSLLDINADRRVVDFRLGPLVGVQEQEAV